ncbi:MAG: hypothetical protein CVT85_08185 [Alphaproteobacteria bacterium HGW-Alphaproteobacteria-7]|nr:MAG: hypothetical protein CVT85_08185 [Alphaproteobacteria bacterium HGW-Alphaproteobacteria-7]
MHESSRYAAIGDDAILDWWGRSPLRKVARRDLCTEHRDAPYSLQCHMFAVNPPHGVLTISRANKEPLL